MDTPYPSLFQPLQIGRMKLRNRIVMPAMSTNFADPENPGFVSKRHLSYYGERAKGGAGLIILEATNINPFRAARKNSLALNDDKFIPGLKALVTMIKEQGARCAIQFSHGGRISGMKVDFAGNPLRSSLGKSEYLAVSALPHPVTGVVAKELTESQLDEIIKYFVEAAKRGKTAGFDAIELHGAHGYLLNEFVSPYTNKREDQFGGDLDGRIRFPLRVVKAVKDKIGDDLVLSYRMSVVEFCQGGIDIQESIYFAKELEAAGVGVIHVSAGSNETLASMNQVIPPMSYPKGRLAPYAEQIKKVVKIPVIVVQRINTPELADDLIRTGKADMVATGRALIADPHWPLKAKEGRRDEIRRCIGCNQGCMENIVMEKSLTCLHNPEVGYEYKYGSWVKKRKKKNILIMGGGVAGMEAAVVLKRKGYDVKLVEKDGQLGGSARAASIMHAKNEFSGVIEYLKNQITKMHVHILLNSESNGQGTIGNNFEEIIVATGSTPKKLGIELDGKVRIRFAKEVLENPSDIGQDVFIIGGGSVGIEVAEFLSHMGKNVSVFEMLDKVCADLGPLNRADLLERIKTSNIRIFLNSKVLKGTAAGIVLLKNGKEEVVKPPDTIVFAIGAEPNPISLPFANRNVHYMGDCRKVGNAMEAIHEAFKVAAKL